MSESSMSETQAAPIATETAGQASRSRKRWRSWKIIALTVAIALVSTVGIAAANGGEQVLIRGGNPGNALLRCGGGMTSLAHIFDQNASLFPGDPAVEITVVNTIAVDFFLLEKVSTGTHTSTHLDAPGHFDPAGRLLDELEPTDFVWPAYVIDVRDRMASQGPDFRLTPADIRAYEADNGRILPGSMVIIQTGFETKFGTPAYVDDVFPGFAGRTVQWLFDNRDIGGVGSDTLGPDASSDGLFRATDTALRNDGVAMPGLTNLDSLNHKGDIIMAPAVPLVDGSGYQVNPLACHGL